LVYLLVVQIRFHAKEEEWIGPTDFVALTVIDGLNQLFLIFAWLFSYSNMPVANESRCYWAYYSILTHQPLLMHLLMIIKRYV